MGVVGRTFRVFISSTFGDLKEERNALQQYVYPRLRELCARYGCRFQAVDLRWGISEEASLDQLTMEVCLGELALCQKLSPKPNFLVLLGGRYGWRPLPYRIRGVLFDAIHVRVCAAPEHCDRLCPDHPKGAADLLLRWYCRTDRNDPDEARILSARDPNSPFAEYDVWSAQVEIPIRRILQYAMQDIDIDPAERFSFEASATHQEIQRGALSVQGASDHVFAFVREISNGRELAASHDHGGLDYLDWIQDDTGSWIHDPAARQGLDAVKLSLEEAIGQDNLYRYPAMFSAGAVSTDHVGILSTDLDECLALFDEKPKQRSLCVDAWISLGSVIEAECRALELLDPLTEESGAHNAFRCEAASGFVGRRNELATIERYLTRQLDWPLSILGASGSGMTALMARAIQDLAGRLGGTSASGFVLIERYVGLTPDSSNLHGLLNSICDEATRSLSGERVSPTRDLDLLGKQLRAALEGATLERPVYLFIDGYDRLSSDHGYHEFPLVFDVLPKHVRIVVTGESLPDFPPRPMDPALHQVHLGELTKADASALLEKWLALDERSLTPEQQEEVLDCFQGCRGPRSLRLAFEEARRWRSFDGVPDYRGHHGLSRDLTGLILDILWRLSRNVEHGPGMVSRTLEYMLVSRDGLSEDELIDLLSRTQDVYLGFIRKAHHLPSDLVREVRSYDDGPKGKEREHPEEWLRRRIEDPTWARRFLERTVMREDGPRLPIVLLSRLLIDLRRYLVVSRVAAGAHMMVLQKQVGDVVRSQQMDDETTRQRHRHLADYFVERWSRPDHHAVLESPYQLQRAGLQEAAADLLLDTIYVQLRLDLQGSPLDLIATVDEVSEALPSGASSRALFQDYSVCLQTQLFSLSSPTRTVLTQIHPYMNELAKEKGGEASAWLAHQVNAHRERSLPWLCQVTPPRQGQASVLTMGAGSGGDRITGHSNRVTAVATYGDRLFALSGSTDGTLVNWDLERTTANFAVRTEAGELSTISIDRREEVAVTGHSDGRWCMWRLGGFPRKLKEERVPEGQDAIPVTCCAISPDGRTLALGRMDGSFRLRPLRDGGIEGEFTYRKPSASVIDAYQPATQVQYYPDGEHLLVHSRFSNTCIRWNLTEARPDIRFGGTQLLSCASMDPAGQTVVAGTLDGSLHLFRANRWQTVWRGEAHDGEVRSCGVSDCGCFAFTGGADRRVLLWNLCGVPEPLADWPLPAVATCGSIQSGGASVLVATADGGVHLLGRDGATPGRWDPSHASRVDAVVTDANGRRSLTAGYDRTALLWDLNEDTMSIAHELRVDGEVLSCALSPDGALAAIGLADGAVLLLDESSGATEPLIHRPRSVSKCLFSADGKRLLIGDDGGNVVALDIATRRPLWERNLHQGAVLSLAEARGGRSLVTSGIDETFKVTDTETGTLCWSIGTLIPWFNRGGDVFGYVVKGVFIAVDSFFLVPLFKQKLGFDRVNDCLISSRGDTCATLSERAVTLWDFHSQRSLCSFRSDGPLTCIGGSEDRFVVGYEDGRICFLSARNVTARLEESGRANGNILRRLENLLAAHPGIGLEITLSAVRRLDPTSSTTSDLLAAWEAGVNEALTKRDPSLGTQWEHLTQRGRLLAARGTGLSPNGLFDGIIRL